MYPRSNALGYGYYIGIVVERMSESLCLLWAEAFLLCVASIGVGSYGGDGVSVLWCLGSGCLGLRFKTLRSVVAIGYCPCFLDRHYSCLDRKYCLLVPYYCLLDGNNSGIVVKAKAAGVKEVFTVLSGSEVFKVGSELLSCMP